MEGWLARQAGERESPKSPTEIESPESQMRVESPASLTQIESPESPTQNKSAESQSSSSLIYSTDEQAVLVNRVQELRELMEVHAYKMWATGHPIYKRSRVLSSTSSSGDHSALTTGSVKWVCRSSLNTSTVVNIDGMGVLQSDSNDQVVPADAGTAGSASVFRSRPRYRSNVSMTWWRSGYMSQSTIGDGVSENAPEYRVPFLTPRYRSTSGRFAGEWTSSGSLSSWERCRSLRPSRSKFMVWVNMWAGVADTKRCDRQTKFAAAGVAWNYRLLLLSEMGIIVLSRRDNRDWKKKRGPR